MLAGSVERKMLIPLPGPHVPQLRDVLDQACIKQTHLQQDKTKHRGPEPVRIGPTHPPAAPHVDLLQTDAGCPGKRVPNRRS